MATTSARGLVHAANEGDLAPLPDRVRKALVRAAERFLDGLATYGEATRRYYEACRRHAKDGDDEAFNRALERYWEESGEHSGPMERLHKLMDKHGLAVMPVPERGVVILDAMIAGDEDREPHVDFLIRREAVLRVLPYQAAAMLLP
jgi:hypothetical protein